MRNFVSFGFITFLKLKTYLFCFANWYHFNLIQEHWLTCLFFFSWFFSSFFAVKLIRIVYSSRKCTKTVTRLKWIGSDLGIKRLRFQLKQILWLIYNIQFMWVMTVETHNIQQWWHTDNLTTDCPTHTHTHTHNFVKNKRIN